VWADKPCSCGRTLPLLSRVEGRVADYVAISDGSYISGISLTENFAVKVPGVAQMQIVQEDIDQFTFNMVKGDDFDSDSLQILNDLVLQYFGVKVKYNCVYLNRILPEKSGKYRFCISKVEKKYN